MRIPVEELAKDFFKFYKYTQLGMGIEIKIIEHDSIKGYLKSSSDSDVVNESLLAYDNRMTYKDFVRIDCIGKRYELIDGCIHLLAGTSTTHQRIIDQLMVYFNQYFTYKSYELIVVPYDITLSVGKEKSVVQPDLIVVCDKDKLQEIGGTGAPLLVVEIASPNDIKRNTVLKYDLYRLSGVKEYWLVDSEKTSITVYHFENHEMVERNQFHSNQATSFIFCDLVIPVEQLF
ncbi:MAG: Uma2 family endonuclease [Clostridiales bacterium]|nr:Uma2 family endonuclease [Clostridiales bacterium]